VQNLEFKPHYCKKRKKEKEKEYQVLTLSFSKQKVRVHSSATFEVELYAFHYLNRSNVILEEITKNNKQILIQLKENRCQTK
jgi:hypothetical protein